MYWSKYNKSSGSLLSKTKIIVILSAILASEILIYVYADRPIMDFGMELGKLETNSRFKLSCLLMNRGMKSERDVIFVLEVPQGLRIIDENKSVYFDSFPPLTRKNLEWTIEAVEIGAFNVECAVYSKTGAINKKLNIQVVYDMTIIIEKVKVIDDTDLFDPGEIYLTITTDSIETRIPEDGEIQMGNGDTVEISKSVFQKLVSEEPLLTVNVFDRDPLWTDSLGSISEYLPFNIGSTWFTTDNGKAEVLVSSDATIKIIS